MVKQCPHCEHTLADYEYPSSCAHNFADSKAGTTKSGGNDGNVIIQQEQPEAGVSAGGARKKEGSGSSKNTSNR